MIRKKLSSIALVLTPALLLVAFAFAPASANSPTPRGWTDRDHHCVPVGGAIITNLGALAPDEPHTTLGPATGDLAGAVAATVRSGPIHPMVLSSLKCSITGLPPPVTPSPSIKPPRRPPCSRRPALPSSTTPLASMVTARENSLALPATSILSVSWTSTPASPCAISVKSATPTTTTTDEPRPLSRQNSVI
jgi:hypothetical protein